MTFRRGGQLSVARPTLACFLCRALRVRIAAKAGQQRPGNSRGWRPFRPPKPALSADLSMRATNAELLLRFESHPRSGYTGSSFSISGSK